MNNPRKNINLFAWLVIGLAAPIVLYCFRYFPLEKLDLTFGVLFIIAIFIVAPFSIQLPRTKIHLSLSEATIFYFLFTYGIEAAVLAGALEAFYASFALRWKKLPISNQTIAVNVVFTIISTFISGMLAKIVFGGDVFLTQNLDVSFLVKTLTFVTFTQFLANALLVAAFTSLRGQKKFFEVLTDNCFNALIIYAICAAVAGLMIEAIGSINPLLLAVAALVAGDRIRHLPALCR